MGKENCVTISQKLRFLSDRYELIKKKTIGKEFKYEDEFQGKMFFYLSGLEMWYPDMYTWSIPNGDFRHKSVAKRLKATGVRAGISDMMSIGGGKMIFIENKRIGGRVSDAQKRFEAKCHMNGMEYRMFDNSRDVELIVIDIWTFLYK